MSSPVTPWLQDADVTLYHGDVLAVLPSLEAESVDCVVTSPPYWGLRDYGTGAWDGGDAECDHRAPGGGVKRGLAAGGLLPDGSLPPDHKYTVSEKVFGDTCGKCGATRIDQQLGLEPTPEQYVERMVEVFREVRRVLAPHGTVWLNLGDSYANLNHAPGTTATVNNRAGWGDIKLNSGKIPSGLKPKDLVGIPWRVAFALQADGWYLRSDIIWAKPNPMPESVTDRPTKAHEYVFLLSKNAKYHFDQEAVREDGKGYGRGTDPHGKMYARVGMDAEHVNGGKGHTFEGGRNIRSVWPIATQPYPEAHFATFPEELARRCIAAGCPEQVCRVCGKARERVVKRSIDESRPKARQNIIPPEVTKAGQGTNANGSETWGHYLKSETLGWTDCECEGGNGERQRMRESRLPDGGSGSGAEEVPGLRMAGTPSEGKYRPGRVLDPFVGSGTVCYVARKLGRHAVGIDLSAEYLELAARRLQQQSLFAEAL